MKEHQDHIRDISEIRSMMERSTKFLSLSGWAGIMAGIYALAGVYVAHAVLAFQPGQQHYTFSEMGPRLIALAILVFLSALGTAVFLSWRKANGKGERLWNATTRRLLAHMMVPLLAGGFVAIVFCLRTQLGLLAPVTLVFYGLALYNASKFTYNEIGGLGLIQTGLGLLGFCFMEYGLLFWALGFGVAHIAYGIYMHYTYER